MGCYQKAWTITAAAADADGIAFTVDVGIRQTPGSQLFHIVGGPFRLHERRRRNLCHADLFTHGFFFPLLDICQGGLHPRVCGHRGKALGHGVINGHQILRLAIGLRMGQDWQ